MIVDDNPKRYQQLLSEIGGIGLRRDDIDVVQSANDARDRLDEEQFDLLVLDLLIPLRAGDEESERNALDLITEIKAGGLNFAPTQIVGITADASVADLALPVFSAHLWTLINYRPDSSEWVVQLLNCMKYLGGLNQSPAQVSHGVDVAVICALAEPELSAIKKLSWSWGASRPIDESTFVYDGVVPCDGEKLTVVACSASRMGMVSTALLTAKVIEKLRPRLLVMTGIAAGVRTKTQFGDVLFADPTWDWQSGKRLQDKENTQFSAAPHQLPAPTVVRSHVEQIKADEPALRAIASAWTGAKPAGHPKIKIGPVASGSAVLADGEVINMIKDQHRELVGIEMESYGLFAAAHTASYPQPLAFSLKAVCDFADGEKNDDFQEYAAFTSASVLDLLLRRFGRRLAPLGRK